MAEPRLLAAPPAQLLCRDARRTLPARLPRTRSAGAVPGLRAPRLACRSARGQALSELAALVPGAAFQNEPHDREHDRHFDQYADDRRERRARLKAEQRDG